MNKKIQCYKCLKKGKFDHTVLIDKVTEKEFYFCAVCRDKLRKFIVEDWPEKHKNRVLFSM
jgi:hypothetical protein